jgi:hypothetical protein
MKHLELDPETFFDRRPAELGIGDRFVGMPVRGCVSASAGRNLRLLADALDRLELAHGHISVSRLHDVALRGDESSAGGATWIEGTVTAARRRSESALVTMRLKVKSSNGRSVLRVSLEIAWGDPHADAGSAPTSAQEQAAAARTR